MSIFADLVLICFFYWNDCYGTWSSNEQAKIDERRERLSYAILRLSSALARLYVVVRAAGRKLRSTQFGSAGLAAAEP